MKHNTINLAKFKKLQRRLQLPKYAAAGLLELLWITTQTNAPAGDIGRLDDETIAIELDWPSDPNELVAALVETGWLDRDPVHRLLIHDWPSHAPRYIHGLVARQNGFSKPTIVANCSSQPPTPSPPPNSPPPSPCTASTQPAPEPTIVANCSSQLQSPTTVAHHIGVQPNLTKPNLTNTPCSPPSGDAPPNASAPKRKPRPAPQTLDTQPLPQDVRADAEAFFEYRRRGRHPLDPKEFTAHVLRRCKKYGPHAVAARLQEAAGNGHRGWDFADAWQSMPETQRHHDQTRRNQEAAARRRHTLQTLAAATVPVADRYVPPDPPRLVRAPPAETEEDATVLQRLRSMAEKEQI